MYEGNQREMDFGSSKREVRVSEGSSYRESTVKLSRVWQKLKKEAWWKLTWMLQIHVFPLKLSPWLVSVIVFVLKGSSLFLVLIYNLRFLAQKDHTCCDCLILRQFLHLYITTKGQFQDSK